jgi:hypothetical protein
MDAREAQRGCATQHKTKSTEENQRTKAPGGAVPAQAPQEAVKSEGYCASRTIGVISKYTAKPLS